LLKIKLDPNNFQYRSSIKPGCAYRIRLIHPIKYELPLIKATLSVIRIRNKRLHGGGAKLKSHYIHFNRRDIRLRFPTEPSHPWFSEFQSQSGGLEGPQFHVTRAINGRASEVKCGDIIWLVGQLYAPWGECFPPTLDARIDVKAVHPRIGNPGYRYTAAETSRWFTLTDSTEYLHDLRCINSEGISSYLWKDHNRSIGLYLQQMRKLANGAILKDWEKLQDSKPLHFVSYRVCDGSHDAYRCSQSLFDEGLRIFWDRWSLPRRLAERREVLGDQPLCRALESKIYEADIVWGIESPLYGELGSYSARERDLAKTLNKYSAFAISE